MRLGFNNNFPYKGTIVHIQTEDSGKTKPVITTLLYQDGTILGSNKLQYGDVLSASDLDAIVDDMMKEQHKAMLRRLKAGEFDGKLSGIQHDHQRIKKNENATGIEESVYVPTNNQAPFNEQVPLNLVVDAQPSIDDAIKSFFGI